MVQDNSTRSQPQNGGLPSGENPQWANLARTHAEHQRHYNSLRAIVKRHVSREHDWRAYIGIIVLLIVFALYSIAT
jgi:hypothetical protein